jgi:hypothetical protein
MKLKRLSLTDLCALYQLFKPALSGRKIEDKILDEVEMLIKLSAPGTLWKALNILYKKVPENISGLDAVLALINGLQQNDFYYFVDIMDGKNERI